MAPGVLFGVIKSFYSHLSADYQESRDWTMVGEAREKGKGEEG